MKNLQCQRSRSRGPSKPVRTDSVAAWIRFVLVGLSLSGCAPVAAQVVDLLPDLIVNPNTLTDHSFVKDIIPGRVHMRLSNSTPNIGLGELRIRAGAFNGLERLVDQVIQRSNGTSFTQEAGRFIFHPTHNHFHVDDWAQYRVREVLPGDGVGPILAEGAKTSFCLLDSVCVDLDMDLICDVPTPPRPAVRQFFSCGIADQGISVGWEDIYFKELPDQWIDITGLAPGTYWLESEVDPENHILEVDETNNTARIKFTVAAAQVVPDEIPLHRGLPWVLSVVLFFSGAAVLRRVTIETGGTD